MPRLEPDDQASGLRRLLGERNAFRPIALFGPDPDLNGAVAANLAFALSQRGSRVCLLDEAPGPRNVAGQLGLTPRHGLDDIAKGDLTIDETLVTLAQGAYLLRADQGMAGVMGADDHHWSRLADEFAAADLEWLLLTAPADERPSLALTATRRLLVLPATKSRLTEAYAILKAAHQRQPNARWLAVFMNADDDGRTEQLMAALNETTRRFLDLDIDLLGSVPKDIKLDVAMRSMRPLHQIAPATPATLAFRQLAARLHEREPGESMDARTFWQRLALFGRLNRPSRPQTTRHPQHGRAYG